MHPSPLFVHLRAASAFSLLKSTLHPEDVVACASAHDMPAVAIADHNNLFGVLEFADAARQAGVQPIIGLSLTVRWRFDRWSAPLEGALALYAQNKAGYANLMRLSSAAFLEADDGAIGVEFSKVLEEARGVIALTGGQNGLIAQILAKHGASYGQDVLAALARAFRDRLYVEIDRIDGQPGAQEEALLDLAYEQDLPIVGTHPVLFRAAADHPACDVLWAIGEGTGVSAEHRRGAPPQAYFKSADEMAELFADLPEALANSVEIAQRCAFAPKSGAPILPKFRQEPDFSAADELRAEAVAGLKARLDAITLAAPRRAYWRRLAFELNIIARMDFAGYFLIVSDFIKWAKARGIPVGPGRGSGAGSLVAYALTITDLDPLRFGLLFERFLNPERKSMPDFDIDFCQDRRGEVISYVRERYGSDRVAQIITFGSLQARAAVRDVGRAMQLPFGLVDRLAKMIPVNPANPISLNDAIGGEPRLQEEMERDADVQRLLETALKLEGLYRNASTHAAGIVIGDRPLEEITPLYRDPSGDMPATQFNMGWAEKAGLVKFDFLGLKTLTVIERAIGFVRETGQDVDFAKILLDEPAVYALLAEGHTLGVFQLEGKGMRETLKKVKPSKFEDIIALISLYRPGPMDNIDEYCDVKYQRREKSVLHPAISSILDETYGVIVYQEQVMQIAQVLAGYSLGEADVLRRAMGKKKKEEMAAQLARFCKGAKDLHDIPESRAKEIFEQVEKFAGYGFNKSHAAAYALVAFQTAYLKAKHPVAFLAASMSLDIDNTDKLAAFVQEAGRMGIKVLGPSIQRARADFSVEDGAILYALGAVRGVGLAAMRHVEAARHTGGPFADIMEFAQRVGGAALNKRILEALAKAGAFDAFNLPREQALAAAPMLAAAAQSASNDAQTAQITLFSGPGTTKTAFNLPQVKPWTTLEKLDAELQALGFYFSGHPLTALLARAGAPKITLYARMMAEPGDLTLRMGGIVRKKTEKPTQKGEKRAFVLLSDPSGEYEIAVMPEALLAFRALLNPGQAIQFRARVRREAGETRITADQIAPLEVSKSAIFRGIEIKAGAEIDTEALANVLLSRPGASGRAQIRLVLGPDQEAVIEVPELAALSADQLPQVEAVRGVREVQVAAG